MSFLPPVLSEDGSCMLRRNSSTQWFILETYKQILTLSLTCLFYVLALSWNLVKILALQGILRWPTLPFLYMKILGRCVDMFLKIIFSYGMGLTNGELLQETRRQEEMKLGIFSPHLLLIGLLWFACVLSLNSAAYVDW